MRNIFSLVAFVSLSLSSWAQGRIEGKIFEAESKQPVSRIIVKLVAPSFERYTKTNDIGEYFFESLNTGIFTIVIS